MGLFSFVRGIGQKLSPSREDAPAETDGLSESERSDLAFQNALTRFVHEMRIPVKGLRITFRDGVATVEGEAETNAHRENIVIAIGNTNGVESVDDRMTAAAPSPRAVFYTVKSGDTLSAIAKAHYGSASKYPAIFEANRPMLSDPDRIYPGQVLRIPQE